MKNYYSFRDISGKNALEQYKKAVIKAIDATLKAEELALPGSVSVLFVCDNEMRGINNEFRGSDINTDVLSFPASDDFENFPGDPENGALLLGDIVINTDRAARQAEELGQSSAREIVFLTIHSVLHLLGYDHEISKDEEEIMCERQKEILKAIERSK